jgi:uncharacterized protein YggE
MNVLNPVFASTVLLALGAWLSLAAVTRPGEDREDEVNDRSPRTMTVRGEGEVRAAPGEAHVTGGVQTQADSASRALESNNQAMERLMNELQRLEIAKTDIQTIRFDVTLRYRRDDAGDGPGEVVGYEVTNEVRVIVRKIEALGGILDAAVAAGANRIHDIRFEISGRRTLLDQARRMAVEDAARKARVLAEAAGVELGSPLEVSEPPPAGGPRPLLLAQRMEADASVPIAPGEQILTTQIDVTFELREAR